jgi:ubiquinone/menaquinone biosynthesis C-methylase UbiE
MNFIEQRISFFNKKADAWNEPCSVSLAERLHDIVRLANFSNNSLKIVDAGSGTGVLIEPLLKIIGDQGTVIAVDPAENMLVKLKQKYLDPRIITKCEILEDCTIETSSIDAIFCFSCFPHLADKQKSLHNCSRILKKNGLLAIIHLSSRDEINDFHKKCPTPICYDYLPDQKEMTALLNKAGFVIEHFVDKSGCYELLARNKR